MPQTDEDYRAAKKTINHLSTQLVGKPGALAGIFCEVECIRAQMTAMMQLLVSKKLVTEADINVATIPVMHETCSRLQDQLLQLNQAKEAHRVKQEEEARKAAEKEAGERVPEDVQDGQSGTGNTSIGTAPNNGNS